MPHHRVAYRKRFSPFPLETDQFSLSQRPVMGAGFDSAEEMLASMLGRGSGIDPIKRLIIEKAACNPFFMEEMAGDLFDQGVLLRGHFGGQERHAQECDAKRELDFVGE